MRRICVVLMTICLTLGCMAQQFEKDVFTTASGKKLTITCIKHASIMMEYDGKVIYFDPVTNLEPRTDFTTWPKANFIFVTHEHHDHFDSMALTEACAGTIPSSIVTITYIPSGAADMCLPMATRLRCVRILPWRRYLPITPLPDARSSIPKDVTTAIY